MLAPLGCSDFATRRSAKLKLVVFLQRTAHDTRVDVCGARMQALTRPSRTRTHVSCASSHSKHRVSNILPRSTLSRRPVANAYDENCRRV